MHTETLTAPAAPTTGRWTREFRGFPGFGQCHVAVNGRLEVMSTGYARQETGHKGWAFVYNGRFFREVHDGFRTQREAKAAAEAYLTTPIR